MANNRLYLEDTATGDRLLVASSMGGGWRWHPLHSAITAWLIARDIEAAFGNACEMQPTSLRLVTENELPASTGAKEQ